MNWGIVMLKYPVRIWELILKHGNGIITKCPTIGYTCDSAMKTDKRAKTPPRKTPPHHNPFRFDCWNKAIVIKFFIRPSPYILTWIRRN
jgi:hypothetical protein